MLALHKFGIAFVPVSLVALPLLLAIAAAEVSVGDRGSGDSDGVPAAPVADPAGEVNAGDDAEVPVERVGSESSAASAEPPLDVARMCPDLDDENGRWEGSLLVGGNFSLKCAPGFKIQGRGGRSATLRCPENAEWREEMMCEDVDDCVKLKYGCGALGMCVDKINGYECNCEEGSHRHLRDGEIYCGSRHSCGGHSCGAHGVCVDIRGDVAQYDTKQNATANATGNTTGSNVSRAEHDRRLRGADSVDSYRCECSAGFFDDGMKCAPLDCGVLEDELGTWSGQSTFGDEYTLACPEDAFVWGGSLANVTMSCGSNGRWLSKPVCISPKHEKEKAVEEAAQFWFCLCMALLCVACGALASGLTLGLTSIDLFQLRLIAETRPEDFGVGKDITEKKRKQEHQALRRKQHHAKTLEPLVSDHHLLLVTLLLFNTVANEALPIFLEDLVPAWAAVVLAVTVVLICGEILPSAVFTGPNQFAVASACAPLVRFLQFVFHPVAHPLARLLDRMLHDSDDHSSGDTKYSRAQIQTFLRMQAGTNITCSTLPDSVALSAPLASATPNTAGGGPNQEEEPNDKPPDAEEGVDDGAAENALSQAEYALIHGSLSLKDALLRKQHIRDEVIQLPYREGQPGGVAFVEATSTGDDALATGLLMGGPAALIVVRQGALPKNRPLAHTADLTHARSFGSLSIKLPEANVVGVLQPAELVRAGPRKLQDVLVELNRMTPPTVDAASASALEALRLLVACRQLFALVVRQREGQCFVLGVIPRTALLRRVVRHQHKHLVASKLHVRGSVGESQTWGDTDSDNEGKDDDLPPQTPATPFATGPKNWRQRFRRHSLSKSFTLAANAHTGEDTRRIGSSHLSQRSYSQVMQDDIGAQPSLARNASTP